MIRKILFAAALIMPLVCAASTPADEARGVVERTFGRMPANVEFVLTEKAASGCDRFATEVKNGVLRVEGSSTVALCRGFYDYLLENGYGICSWSGNRLDLPATFPDAARRECVSPFARRLYMNVCTFGYTTAFWGWEEWEREIDRMALLGFDMPLAPVAAETIMARVWREMGLSQAEIDEWLTGPAHLPWLRMGNMSRLDGAPSAEWHEAQTELQHRILDRLRALGMTPVCQGFAGFVPPAMKRLHPEAQLTETAWWGFTNCMLSPLDPLFAEMGAAFVRAWESEFGKCKYYLIDSFNEMDIPFGEQGSPERAELLHRYGNTIYNSLAAANPDAVWVMQGWMFGCMRWLWDPASVAALLSGAPDDRMMIIDLAVDSNNHIWHSSNSWDYLSGMFGKEWIYSTVPNFGGRTALVGNLEFYANGHLAALGSPRRGALTGFGTSPEGLENNEVVYEVIASAGWRDHEIPLAELLGRYSAARYGGAPARMERFWSDMLRSSYGECSDNARFRWQLRPYSQHRATMGINDFYYRAVEEFLSCADSLGGNELYRTDAVAYAALYLAAKADDFLEAASWADLAGDKERLQDYGSRVERLLLDADRLLESHPLLRLDRWCSQAARAAHGEEERARFVTEARRLVSVWGGYLHDYSPRVWSGLIRDFHVPRLRNYFDAKNRECAFDFGAWDEKWYASGVISPVEPFADPLEAACRIVGEVSEWRAESPRPENGAAFWSPFELAQGPTVLRFSIDGEQFGKARALRIVPVRGADRVVVKSLQCTSGGCQRVWQPLDVGISAAEGAVGIPLVKLEAAVPLSKEVNVSLELECAPEAESYAMIELVND